MLFVCLSTVHSSLLSGSAVKCAQKINHSKADGKGAGVVYVAKSWCLSGCPQQGLAGTAPLINAASLSE